MVSVDEPPDVTEAGLNEAVAPDGRPLADRLTDCAEPDVVAVVDGGADRAAGGDRAGGGRDRDGEVVAPAACRR